MVFRKQIAEKSDAASVETDQTVAARPVTTDVAVSSVDPVTEV